MEKRNINFVLQAISFIVPFIIYYLTLAPTVSFIDTGELATVSSVLGVAHPTGYPLFTLIGNLFTKLPFGEQIFNLNLMCAFLSSLTILVFYNLLSFLFIDFNLSKAGNNIKNNVISKIDIKSNVFNLKIIALAGSLIFAFSKTFWMNANSLEVYSLHALFLVLILFTFLKACFYTEKGNFGLANKFWVLFSFILGLSFTNHLSTIFLSIGIIYLFFSINGFNKVTFQRILILAIPFLVGLSVYIYLLVRADNTILSWGYPHNLENLYKHISGKQFSIWMFSSTENASKQFSYFIKSFPKEFLYVPLIFAILGLVELFKTQRKLFNFTLILFVFNVLYAINYDIYDIDSYFLLSFIVSTIWIGFGFSYLIKKYKKNSKELSFATLILFLLPLTQNYSVADLSKNYFVKDYTMNIFNSAPENSIIISHQWDFWVSPSIYFQNIKNIRKDLVIIDKELLRKSWYIKYIRDHYPEIYENSKKEFDIYEIELIKFEKFTERYSNPKTPTDMEEVRKIQTAFKDLFESILNKNYGKRDFFTTYEIEQEKNERFGVDFNRIPVGLLIKYSKEKGYVEIQDPILNYTITNKEGYHHEFLMNAYYNSFISRDNYLLNFSEFEKAELMLQKAQEIKPQGPEINTLRKKLNELKSLQDTQNK